MSSPVGVFFQDSGFDLHTQPIEGVNYDFILNDHCPELINIPRLQTIEKLTPTVIPFVRSYIHKDLFLSTKGKQMLSSYFVDGVDVDLVDRFSKEYKQIYNVKIHDYLNMGFFIDSIILEAYKNRFDIKILRDYLNTSLLYAFKKMEAIQDSMPLDLSYSHDGEAFTIQISISGVQAFNGREDLKEIFEDLTKKTNYFDAAYFSKRKKLVISSLFFNDAKLRERTSYFFTEIGERSKLQSPKEDSDIVSGLEPKDAVSYKPEKVEDFQARKLAVARKFTLFIKNYRANEANAIPLEKIEIKDVETYLEFYPRQEAVTEADDEVKSYICKLLKDEQLSNGINEYVQKVSGNMDTQLPEFQRILGNKSLQDIEEVIKISGNSKLDSDVNVVKGWIESKDKDGKTIVSGNDSGMSDNDIWEIKKSQLNVKIKDEVQRIKSEGKIVTQDDVIRIISTQLNTNENDVKTVVKGILEEVVATELVRNQKLEESFALKILGSQGADQVREKLESQIGRMKKIMDQLKRELVKLQNEKTIREASHPNGESTGVSEDALQVKAALGRSLEALKLKDRMIEKAKSDFEQISKAKDQKIASLEQRVEESRVEFARSREFANEEKLQQLEVENKSLNARLELAYKKVNIMNGNLENREIEINDRREKELETLKANMQVAQSVIERFKNDKLEMEQRFQEEREASRKLKEGSGSVQSLKTELEERDSQISSLQSDKKVIEEKFRALSIELKKVEQKLKYSTSQLVSSNKKAVAASGQKSVESYIKQVEQVTSRFKDATNEIAEKRKELVKLKQENTLMQSKLAELEKKLGMADKKAS